MRKRNKGKASGFTLIEVMITLLVFMVVVMGMVAMQSASLEGIQKSRETTMALGLGQYYLTQLENEVRAWRPGVVTTSLPGGSFHMIRQPIVANDFGSWYLLPADTASSVAESYLLNEFFEDKTVDSSALYCVNYLAQPLELPTDPANSMVWALRVRVTWPKQRQYTDYDKCTAVSIDARLDSTYAIELAAVANREFGSGS